MQVSYKKTSFDNMDLANCDRAVTAVLAYMGCNPAIDAMNEDIRVKVRKTIMAIAIRSPKSDCSSMIRLAIRRLN